MIPPSQASSILYLTLSFTIDQYSKRAGREATFHPHSSSSLKAFPFQDGVHNIAVHMIISLLKIYLERPYLPQSYTHLLHHSLDQVLNPKFVSLKQTFLVSYNFIKPSYKASKHKFKNPLSMKLLQDQEDKCFHSPPHSYKTLMKSSLITFY